MYTYQEFLEMYQLDGARAVEMIVNDHKGSREYKVALDADEYDHQRNITIVQYQKTMKTLLGADVPDPYASNVKIPSNFFRRLNTQRNQYLLGNGAYFDSKEKLGRDFDTILQKIGYAALIHGEAFGFWNGERLYCFKLTEFAPIYDEMTGALKAGVRFWRVGSDADKNPEHMWLYTVDGITKFVRQNSDKVELVEETKPYINVKRVSVADGEEIIDGMNFPSFPVVPLWGSELKQSTLVGMRYSIDCYDLIRSGFANDITDAAYVYWLVKNADGMEDVDKAKLLAELKSHHMAVVSGGDAREGDIQDDKPSVTPYTQDVPVEARKAFLEILRHGIYEDFGALDVTEISGAAKTATEINAAYQPLDENADDYEYEVIQFVQGVLTLLGIDETPTFRRNKVSNDFERMQTLTMAASYLDAETIIRKMPSSIVSVDEIDDVLKRVEDADTARYQMQQDALELAAQTQPAEPDADVPPDQTQE